MAFRNRFGRGFDGRATGVGKGTWPVEEVLFFERNDREFLVLDGLEK